MVRVVGGRVDVLLGGNLWVPFFADPGDAFLLGGLPVVDVIFGLWQVDLRKEGLVTPEVIPLSTIG